MVVLSKWVSEYGNMILEVTAVKYLFTLMIDNMKQGGCVVSDVFQMLKLF